MRRLTALATCSSKTSASDLSARPLSARASARPHAPAHAPAAGRATPWALGGALAGALLVLAWQFPAAWVTPWVASASSGRVLLADARGSVWNGSAHLMLSGGPGSQDLSALPERLAWRVRPTLRAGLGAGGDAGRAAPDWAAGLRVTLSQDCCVTPAPALAQLTWSPWPRALRLDQLDWRLPASVVTGLGMPWNTLAFDGQLRLSAPSLQWNWQPDGVRLRGQAELQAEAISSRLSSLRPMGSYRLTLSGPASRDTGTTMRFVLGTTDGALRLQGQGELVGGALRFQGTAGAEGPDREALAHVLNLIGNRSGPVTMTLLR